MQSSSMAEVSRVHLHGEDDEDRGDVLVSFDSVPYWSNDFDGFDVFTSDLDFPASEFRISSLRQHPPRQSRSRGFTDNVSGAQSIRNLDLFDRGNQVNFVMDLFHQRVEQSSSLMEQRFGEMDRFELDLDLGLGLPGSGEIESNSFEVDLDLGLGVGSGFVGDVDPNDDEIDEISGFMVADSGEDFLLPRRNGTISDSGASSIVSGGPEYFMSGLRVVDIESDSEDPDGIEEGFEDENVYDDDDDDDASLQACWDAFQLADGDDNNRGDGNEDFEWEEVDVRIDERQVFGTFFNGEDDDDTSVLPGISTAAEELSERRVVEGLEWEVLLNVHNLEDLGHDGEPFDEYNYAEYELFLGQFGDNENVSIGWPPASKLAVENLLSVVVTRDDVEKNNALCAVCKDEINVGHMAKQLPCVHRYHGECIVPWLGIRNTCPVCRYELPTDDPEYERRKAERTGRTH